MSKKARAGVAGLKWIGWRYHLPTLKGHDGFELAAVADPSPERLKEAEDTFAIRGHADYDEMLRQEELDLVVIAPPTGVSCRSNHRRVRIGHRRVPGKTDEGSNKTPGR